jgi:pimeloyl-ACP methyl ester carboxylesterase
VFCLVHGLGVSQRYFEPLARVLGGEQLRPELREPLSIVELAAQLESTLTGPAVVIANSMGCQIASAVALRRPELVEALVLVGPTVDPGARSAVRQALRLARDAWFEPPRLTGLVLADYVRAGPRRLFSHARFALADAIEERLPEIQVPSLVLRGVHDPLCPESWGQQSAALLRTRLVTIAGAGHAVHYSHPEEVAAEVSRLLAETRAPHG